MAVLTDWDAFAKAFVEAVGGEMNTEYLAVDHPLVFRLDHTVHLDALNETKIRY